MHESGGVQFTASGAPLMSPTHDYGIMQINKAWIPTAKKMGLDVVNSASDNVEFGIWLYTTLGPTQWTTYKKYCKGVSSA